MKAYGWPATCHCLVGAYSVLEATAQTRIERLTQYHAAHSSLMQALMGCAGRRPNAIALARNEIDHLTHPARYAASAGARLHPSALLAVAREAAGKDFAVTALRYPEQSGAPLIAQARANGRPSQGGPPQGLRIWIDPATSRVLDRANARGGLMGTLHQLHGSLMIPDSGRKVVG